MSLGVTDAFVTHSPDNNALSCFPGPEVTWIWNSKFFTSNHLQRRPNDRTFVTTTGCVSRTSIRDRNDLIAGG